MPNVNKSKKSIAEGISEVGLGIVYLNFYAWFWMLQWWVGKILWRALFG